jgi:GntR family transcriptional repressor for pyruvate dehydrogenase complex
VQKILYFWLIKGYPNDYPTGRVVRGAKRVEIDAGVQESRCVLIGRELSNLCLLSNTTVQLQLTRLKLEPAYRKVASTLLERIIDGSLKMGERLPAEMDLARQLGVHRSTIREALRELESKGLLRREPGSRLMMISRPDQGLVARGVSHALTLHDATVAEVWETLTIIEPPVAEQAAKRRDAAAAVKTLAAVVDAAESPDTALAAAQAAEFFRVMANVAGNRVLMLSQESLLQLLDSSLRRVIDAVPQARSRIANAQRRILAAIEQRDADGARSWCEKHIRDYRRGFEIADIDLQLPISGREPFSEAGSRRRRHAK